LHSQVDRHIAADYMIQVQVAPTSTCKMNCTTNSLGRFGNGTSRRRLVCYQTHIEFSACGCRGDVSNVGFQHQSETVNKTFLVFLRQEPSQASTLACRISIPAAAQHIQTFRKYYSIPISYGC